LIVLQHEYHRDTLLEIQREDYGHSCSQMETLELVGVFSKQEHTRIL
jgi:hypothetical protein